MSILDYKPIFSEKERRMWKRKERLKDLGITIGLSAVIVFVGSIELGV